jgi:uncharacterized membrane protein YqaE (UPF0057 family)
MYLPLGILSILTPPLSVLKKRGFGVHFLQPAFLAYPLVKVKEVFGRIP